MQNLMRTGQSSGVIRVVHGMHLVVRLPVAGCKQVHLDVVCNPQLLMGEGQIFVKPRQGSSSLLMNTFDGMEY
jgi:hypothetical protein